MGSMFEEFWVIDLPILKPLCVGAKWILLWVFSSVSAPCILLPSALLESRRLEGEWEIPEVLDLWNLPLASPQHWG